MSPPWANLRNRSPYWSTHRNRSPHRSTHRNRSPLRKRSRFSARPGIWSPLWVGHETNSPPWAGHDDRGPLRGEIRNHFHWGNTRTPTDKTRLIKNVPVDNTSGDMTWLWVRGWSELWSWSELQPAGLRVPQSAGWKDECPTGLTDDYPAG